MTIWLADHVIAIMRNEAAELYPLESGGVLLGWRSDNDLIVTGLLGPGPNALHGRYRFIPDHNWQVAEIKRLFAESQGDLNYLGDWHSHPDGLAEMSREDARTLHRIAKKVPDPMMLIITERTVGCWIGRMQGPIFRRRFELQSAHFRAFSPPGDWPNNTRAHLGQAIMAGPKAAVD